MHWIIDQTGLLTCLLTGATLLQAAPADHHWPQFRGPGALGVSTQTNLPVQWSTNENVAWCAELPGYGWSSPIVWGDKVFVTTAVSEGEVEPPKKGLYFGGERQTPSRHAHRWTVLCLDLKSGEIRWRKVVHQGTPPTPLHIKNTYASETPVTDGERVYAYFGNVGLFCLDRQGQELWSQKWPVVKTRYGWGSAASPVLHGDRLFIVNDNEDQSFLVALDKKSGKQLWRVEREEKSNWATPYVWENDQRTELVTPGRKKVRAYDLEGTPLWELGGMSSIVVPTPFSKFGLLYVCSGYVLDKQRPLFAVRPGATGDISLTEGESTNQFIAWHHKLAGPYNPSPLVYGDYFYVLFDGGFLSCHDARTGAQIYEKQRLNTEGTSAFTASPWAYEGKLFCLSEEGDTFVVQAGPNYKLLRRNSLAEMCMATPAIAEGSLLLRTASKLYCLRNGR
jgi:outer membrane protein assembly factor BamB